MQDLNIYNLQFLVSQLVENRIDLHIAAADQSLYWQVKPISVQCFAECGDKAAARTIDLPLGIGLQSFCLNCYTCTCLQLMQADNLVLHMEHVQMVTQGYKNSVPPMNRFGEAAPAPDIGSTRHPTLVLHCENNKNVLSAVVTLNSAWEAILAHCLSEEFQNNLCMIVVADTNAGNRPGLSIHKAVDNNLKVRCLVDKVTTKQGMQDSSIDKRVQITLRLRICFAILPFLRGVVTKQSLCNVKIKVPSCQGRCNHAAVDGVGLLLLSTMADDSVYELSSSESDDSIVDDNVDGMIKNIVENNSQFNKFMVMSPELMKQKEKNRKAKEKRLQKKKHKAAEKADDNDLPPTPKRAKNGKAKVELEDDSDPPTELTEYIHVLKPLPALPALPPPKSRSTKSKPEVHEIGFKVLLKQIGTRCDKIVIISMPGPCKPAADAPIQSFLSMSVNLIPPQFWDTNDNDNSNKAEAGPSDGVFDYTELKARTTKESMSFDRSVVPYVEELKKRWPENSAGKQIYTDELGYQ
ncbi:hypothetical protein DFH08DRAFT_807898 [Mycena albidolilacea]|uniref:Uncharacterized protein n=1 Tax=Mycena albidolilacea TaxID=1033008 RepID=A0AAD7A4M2_9AGAR|nr:hypothetical protein DFH08DRAFT_807898 [Mycena albidolilacea]